MYGFAVKSFWYAVLDERITDGENSREDKTKENFKWYIPEKSIDLRIQEK